MIPLDGSTINVILDGVSVGPLTSYNLYRSDVSGLFPGLKNSGGPVGYRVIDTTALSEGVHTIAWVATDDAGKATGIGSRYFTVQNSAWQASLKAAARSPYRRRSRAEIALADRTTAVPARIDGADLGRHPESLTALPAATAAARTSICTSSSGSSSLSRRRPAMRCARRRTKATCPRMASSARCRPGPLSTVRERSTCNLGPAFSASTSSSSCAPPATVPARACR